MIIDIITLFPDIFKGFLETSIIKQAKIKEFVEINLHNLRDFTLDKHKKVDDQTYGGGPGMVLMVEPVCRAIEYLETHGREEFHKVLLTPQGRPFHQSVALELAQKKGLILLCGHYEGFDERIRTLFNWDEISIGHYVLTGGEIPAMVITDAVVRLIPGVLGNPDSVKHESFMQEGHLDHPHYTRPRVFRGQSVPEVLLSGHHAKIKEWRSQAALRKS
jgi:tRNA (guanine37-N1)-methyltransferase